MSITINLDFRNYTKKTNLEQVVVLTANDSLQGFFIASVYCTNLIVGNKYQINYSVLQNNNNAIFDPAQQTIYASYQTQNFATLIKVPTQGLYTLSATIRDITLGPTGGDVGTDTITVQCGPFPVTPTPTPTVTPSSLYRENKLNVILLDSDLVEDSIINFDSCSQDLVLVTLASGAIVGNKYSYNFKDYPQNSVSIENRQGEIFAGSEIQNINTKIALTGIPYAFIVSEITDINTGFKKQSQPILLRCSQGGSCSTTILPVGIDINFGAPTFKSCNSRGLTLASISYLKGGTGFSIGDKLTTKDAGGYGAEITINSGGITVDTITSISGGTGFNIGDYVSVTGSDGNGALLKVVSGGITAQSIDATSNNCTGFSIGELITTIGGGGSDALISVTSTGINGSITNFSILNNGYGYTYAPNGIKSLTSNRVCTSLSFNANNFTIPPVGGVTNDSLNLSGGTGFDIGEIISISGAESTSGGAKVRILSGSLSAASINIASGTGYVVGDLLTTTGGNGADVVIRVTSVSSGAITGWEILNGGYGFTSAPTGLVRLTGAGTSATFTGNATNFAITPAGEITSSSISGLIGTGPFSVNDIILVAGGDGNGATIQVTKIDSNQKILEYVITNPGSSYTKTPILANPNGLALTIQPTFNIDNFTDAGYVVTNAGCCYKNTPTAISSDGNGSGMIVQYDTKNFIDPALAVVNPGAGYTRPPTGLNVVTGDGSVASVTASFNGNNFTIPAAGSITYSSMSSLIGKSGFSNGEELLLAGADGTGGRIQVFTNSSGIITKYVILDPGSGYTISPTLTKINGTVIPGILFDPSLFTTPAISVTNPGYGYFDKPSALEVTTGYGNLDTAVVVFNDNHFIEIIGPQPTPSNTPPNTPTPTPTLPALCNDLQFAGGQNDRYDLTVSLPAISGQNFLIVENSPAASMHSILQGAGLVNGTAIISVENYYTTFMNDTNLRKIYLDRNLTANIDGDTQVTGFTVDARIIKTSYWPGYMRFDYDAYQIPDRFKIIGIPLDSNKPQTLLWDSDYRGETNSCGFAVPVALGKGTTTIYKPEGVTNVKVIVEAPCVGTAWEYILYCPIRTLMSPTPTITPTISLTPSITPTISLTPSITPTKTVTPTITLTPSRSR